MRENRTSGSEGGEAQTNELSLPLSLCRLPVSAALSSGRLVFPRFCGHRKKSCSPLQGCALELGGAKVAQGRVAALSIVKDFYIFE